MHPWEEESFIIYYTDVGINKCMTVRKASVWSRIQCHWKWLHASACLSFRKEKSGCELLAQRSLAAIVLFSECVGQGHKPRFEGCESRSIAEVVGKATVQLGSVFSD